MEDLEVAQRPKQGELEAANELPAEPLAGSGQQGNGHHLNELVSNAGRLLSLDSQKKYIHNRHCIYTHTYLQHIQSSICTVNIQYGGNCT